MASPAIEDLLTDLRELLNNTYLDPFFRIWATRVLTVLEDECTTNQPQPKSDSGLGTTTSPSAGEDTSLSTSLKGTTKLTRIGPFATATPSEG